jgi:predicted phage terminase large subunit-like protein
MPSVDRLPLRAIALDPSKGKSDKHGDYSAIVRAGLCNEGLIWVEADLVRRPVSRIVDDLLRHAAEYVPQCVAIETNQFQELLAGEVSRVASERGIALPIVPVENRINKVVRIRTLTPLLAAGRIRFRGGHEGTRLLLEQLRQFPTGQHDDGPDALEMAVRMLAQMRFGVNTEGVAGWLGS